MITVNNIRKSDLKNGCYRISIRGKFKFNISRTIKSISENDFIELANKKYKEMYKIDWNGICRGTKKLTKYTSVINNRWSSINQRCVNGCYKTPNAPQFQSYTKKGITVNMTKEQFITWMLSVEDIHNEIVSKGERSSIDRIDDSKGYEIGNLQLISLHANIEKRSGKTCRYLTTEDKLKKSLDNKKIYDRKVKGIIPEKVKKEKVKKEKVKKEKIIKPYISIKHKIEYNGIIFNNKHEIAKYLNIKPSTLSKRLKQNKIVIKILPL